MWKVFQLCTFVISFIILNDTTMAMSEKQMHAAMKLVRNTCTPKTKANPEDIDKMHKGDWNIDHSAMCYMHCALSSYKLMNKDNTLNYEAVQKQLPQLPESYRASASNCIDKCKDQVFTLDDKCVAAYELTKCMYFCNPDKYFLA